MSRLRDDRVWHPDLGNVLDWGAVWDAGEKRYGDLATWWTQATPGVNYYRAEMPAKHLPGKAVRFESRDVQMRDDEAYFPRQEGAAVWMFPGNDTRAICMAEMHLQGTKVMVEVDDNYTVAPAVPQISSWLATRDKSGQDRHSYEVHRRIVASGFCDGVIVSTPKLWEAYARFGKDVYVCPNSIDPDDWGEPSYSEDVLRIGYAGSDSHRYDFAEIVPALSWAAQQRNVEVVMLGSLEPPCKHRRIPWTNSLAAYRENVKQIDVMLCPIRSNEWADCKSDVKAMEAAMGGGCAVMQDVPPYAPWKGRPGYFASSKKDFLKVVKHLVANRDEAVQTAKEARGYVLAERTIEKGIEAWREAISASSPQARSTSSTPATSVS